MSRVIILGDGQLGKMLKHAGMPLALEVEPQNLDGDLIDLTESDIVTVEREHWPTTRVTQHLEGHHPFENLAAIRVLNDRKTQKATLDQLGIATAKWVAVEQDNVDSLEQHFDNRFLLKKRCGGYDGRGQMWYSPDANIDSEWIGQSIAEQGVSFEQEVSLVGMRDKHGNTYFYPLATNLHIDGILMATIADHPRYRALQSKAEEMLTKLFEHFDYHGTMAMECFVVGDQLMVNELAPRVHNSGHWTQAGASYSQFEAHLRCVAGLPLSKPVCEGTSLMINLIGVQFDSNWHAVPGAKPWWYGKDVRPARKVGHINLSANAISDLKQSTGKLFDLLPEPYDQAKAWTIDLLDQWQ